MFSLVSLYSLLLLSSCTELHDKVFRNLLRLCPAQYVPTDNDTAVNHTSESGSCCTEYFKDSSQGEIDSNKTLPDEYGRTCLFPRTDGRTYGQTENSYYIITHPPKDGCLLQENHTAATTNEFYEPTCNDSDVIPLMNFLPVSSKSKDLIYKNPHCASCHGQHGVTIWQPYANCVAKMPFSYDLNDCQFNFVYPGDYDDIRHLECSTDTFNECPPASSNHPFQIPSDTDLSIDEIAMACSMHGLPRFAHKYVAKNVFCYICHYNRDVDIFEFPLQKCTDPSLSIPFRNPSARRFIRLIDPGRIQQIEATKHSHAPRKTVCGLDGKKKVCHEVLCPLGQVMNINVHARDDVQCQMESTRWVAEKIEMSLLLRFGDSVNVNDSALEKMVTNNQLLNPWRKSWVIVSVHRSSIEYDTMMIDAVRGHIYNISNVHELDSLRHVFVNLNYRSSSVATASLMRNVQETLSKPWYLRKDGKTYKAKQSLSPYTLWSVTASLGQKNSKRFLAPVGQLSHEILLQKRWLYKTVFENSKSRAVGYLLNKLHMCEQVALTSDNFNVTVFQSTTVALYYHRTDSIIFDSEFKRVKGLNGERLFRICVSDIKLKPSSNGRCRPSQDVPLLLFALVFYTYTKSMIHA